MIDVRNNQDELYQLVSETLTEASRQGATAAEVSVNENVGLEVRVRRTELETVEFSHDRGLAVSFYSGQRKGSASTTRFNKSSIVRTVEAAKNISKFTQEDSCSGLADRKKMASQPQNDLGIFNFWSPEPHELQDIAIECESAGFSYDKRIVNSEGAQANSSQAIRVYGNSHGFSGGLFGTRHSLGCSLIAEDSKGMQQDYWYTIARNPNDLLAHAAIGEEAARRAVSKLSPRKIATGVFPVLFSPDVANTLIGHLVTALSGGSLYRKASFLTNSLGEEVLNPHISIYEDPQLTGGFGSCHFDSEGVATVRKNFVENGRVTNYVLGSYSGRKLGMETTGNAGGVFNLQISGLTKSFDDMICDMDRGLLVTDLMGQGVNLVTGDYSRGASGFWIEDGKLAFPVDELTIAGNLKDIYKDIQCIGDDPDNRGNFIIPSILVSNLMVAN